jgi:hypothetical protein
VILLYAPDKKIESALVLLNIEQILAKKMNERSSIGPNSIVLYVKEDQAA